MNADSPLCALVPMRHKSQRVPGKNYRLLDGRPLYRHIVDALIASDCIDRIVIDTDSSVISEDVRLTYGGRVEVINRPAHLTAASVPMNEILMHDVSQIGGDLFLQTHSTNPMLKSETIACAVDKFRKSLRSESHDSLFSVTRRHVRIWGEDGKPLNHDPKVLLQTQDLSPFFEENSCLYLFTAAGLGLNNNRIGTCPEMFEMNPLEAIDIDEESDFLLAEALCDSMKIELTSKPKHRG
ncbi:MAG: acylneuraminate cytidylyltransferase family protein [Sedimenticola sp.]